MDINTISDLLKVYVAQSNKEIQSTIKTTKTRHPTSIGDMYEGLTKEVLNKSIFKGLGLKAIANSFIEGCKTEFDVLLVEGDGTQLNFTDRYIYKPEQVIAIIQSKKNIYSDQLIDAYDNLKKVIEYYSHKHMQQHNAKMFRDAARSILRKDIAHLDKKNLTQQEDYVYSTLVTEAVLPLRIIWGYNGFKSEYNLRESFYNYLKDNLSTEKEIKGYFGPHNFPSLIICENLSMVKLNGMPMGIPLDDGWWALYGTSSKNPARYFLELIWSRLTYRYKELSDDIFGEDLELEPIKRYLSCRVKTMGDKIGWEYDYFHMDKAALKEDMAIEEFTPVELDEEQYVILQALCTNEAIDLIKDKVHIEELLEDSQYESIDSFLENLVNTNLVYIDNDILRLLTKELRCIIMPDGRRLAADDCSGRFSRWVYKNLPK